MRGRVVIPDLTHEELLRVLDYDPATGIFVWKISPAKNIKAGMVAGSKTQDGRYYILYNGEGIPKTRLAWFYINAVWPKFRVTFKNKDKTDFRIENLEVSPGLHAKFDHKLAEERARYGKEYLKTNREILRDKGLKKTFGLALMKYNEMLAAQNGCCAVCKRPERATRNGKVKNLAVDHDHITGEIRGLLCSSCNTGIGKFQDDPEVLLSALTYLRKYKPKKDAVVPLVIKTHSSKAGE